MKTEKELDKIFQELMDDVNNLTTKIVENSKEICEVDGEVEYTKFRGLTSELVISCCKKLQQNHVDFHNSFNDDLDELIEKGKVRVEKTKKGDDKKE